MRHAGFRFALLGALTCLLCTCVTPLPQDSVLILGVRYDLPGPVRNAAARNDVASVTFRRERTALRAGLIAIMTIDDDPLATLAPGEEKQFPLIPGGYLFAVRGIRYLGSQEVKSINQIWLQAESGMKYVLLIHPTVEGGLELMQVDR
jgi:hypothetical protein